MANDVISDVESADEFSRESSVFEVPEYQITYRPDNTLRWSPPMGSKDLAVALSYHFPLHESLEEKMRAATRKFLKSETKRNSQANSKLKSAPGRIWGSGSSDNHVHRAVEKNAVILDQVTSAGVDPPPETGGEQYHELSTPGRTLSFITCDPTANSTGVKRKKSQYGQAKAAEVAAKRGRVCDEHRRRKVTCTCISVRRSARSSTALPEPSPFEHEYPLRLDNVVPQKPSSSPTPILNIDHAQDLISSMKPPPFTPVGHVSQPVWKSSDKLPSTFPDSGMYDPDSGRTSDFDFYETWCSLCSWFARDCNHQAQAWLPNATMADAIHVQESNAWAVPEEVSSGAKANEHILSAYPSVEQSFGSQFYKGDSQEECPSHGIWPLLKCPDRTGVRKRFIEVKLELEGVSILEHDDEEEEEEDDTSSETLVERFRRLNF